MHGIRLSNSLNCTLHSDTCMKHIHIRITRLYRTVTRSTCRHVVTHLHHKHAPHAMHTHKCNTQKYCSAHMQHTHAAHAHMLYTQATGAQSHILHTQAVTSTHTYGMPWQHTQVLHTFATHTSNAVQTWHSAVSLQAHPSIQPLTHHSIVYRCTHPFHSFTPTAQHKNAHPPRPSIQLPVTH